MRNALAISIAFCVTGALAGCNSNQPAVKAPNPVNEAHDALGWQLKLQSKCPETVTGDKCIAAYGFGVLSDGHFQLGPGPQGETRNGTISTDELAQLTSALTPILEAPRLDTAGNFSMDAAESEDTLNLTLGSNAPEVLMTTSGANFSYRTQTAEQAKAIYSAIRNLAVKYYTLPFPDPCSDGAASLQTLYTTLQACTADADCTYLDESFDALNASSGAYLTTDDCSVVRPLVVGNTNSVRSSKDKIIEAIEQIRNACGERLIRSDCSGVTGFQLTGSPAVCRQGVCQANTTH